MNFFQAQDAARRKTWQLAALFGAAVVSLIVLTNLLVAGRNGSLSTPPIASGAVAGIARAILIEQVAEIEERGISKAELLAAGEIIAVNAVRGARPITRLDGRTVGDGSLGGWSERLAEILAAK